MVIKRDIYSILFLTIVIIAFFWGILLKPTELMASGDLISNSVFSANFIHKTYQEYGERALWNPYFFAGKTHTGHFLYGEYYLTGLLYLFYYNDYILNFIIIFHFLLAGIAMYLFLRSINLRRSFSTIGALTFMFGNQFLGLLAGDAIPIISYAYIPLAFLGAEMIIQKRKLMWSILTSIFLSLQFLGGHLQYFYYTCLALLVYTAIRLISEKNLKKQITTIGYLIVSGILLLGLIQIQFLPALELSKFTIQKTSSPTLNVATYEFSAQESIPPKHFITLLIPGFFGERMDNSYWGAPSRLINIYVGVLPLILAIVAIILIRNKYKIAFAILALLSVLFALGGYAPFYKLFFQIPGINLFKVPARMLVIFTFSVAALAALGADSIMTAKEKMLKKTTKILICATGLSFITFILGYAFKNRILAYGESLLNKYYYGIYSKTLLVSKYPFEYFIAKIQVAFNHIFTGFLKLGILLGLSAIVFYLLTKKIKKSTIVKLIIAILLLDFLILTNVYDWSEIKKEIYPGVENSSASLEQWGELAKELNKNGETFRVWGFPQGILVQNNLYLIIGSDSMPVDYSSQYATYAGQLSEPYAPFMLGLANVKYILTQQSLSGDYVLSKEGLVYSDYRFGTNKSFNLYENRKWMPRAFIVSEVKTIELERQFEIIKKQEFNPKEEVLITEEVSNEGGQAYKEADIDYYSPNKISLSVVTEKPGFLVMSDTYYPGWKAYDNGKETKIYHANYIMRALYLPAGEHKIEFVYDPMSYKIGKYITFATLGLVGFLILFLIISRNKQST